MHTYKKTFSYSLYLVMFQIYYIRIKPLFCNFHVRCIVIIHVESKHKKGISYFHCQCISSFSKSIFNVHTVEKPYPCSLCDRYISNFKGHSIIHTGEKNDLCSSCDKFINEIYCISYPEVHIGVHTGERPFSCIFCDMYITVVFLQLVNQVDNICCMIYYLIKLSYNIIMFYISRIAITVKEKLLQYSKCDFDKLYRPAIISKISSMFVTPYYYIDGDG